LQGEVAAPTGNRVQGLGSGVTTFATFAAFGQRLSERSFLQIQTGADLPVNTAKAPQAFFFHTAIGRTFASNHSFGRIWTPMVEFLLDRDLVDAARTNWDLLPEMQVSLNKRHHVRVNVGVRKLWATSFGIGSTADFGRAGDASSIQTLWLNDTRPCRSAAELAEIRSGSPGRSEAG
jgi:hypothetical protein